MDRTSNRSVSGQLKVVVAMVVCLVAIVALPAFAYASPPVVASTAPANAAVLTAKPTSIVVNITDVTALRPAPIGGILVLNGTTVPNVLVSQSPKKVYGYPAAGLYVNGSNNVTATVVDMSGGTRTYAWSFTLDVAPVLGQGTPANGSTVATVTPTISIPFSVSGPGASATATVNGAAAATSLSGGVVRVISLALPNDQVSTVTVTVTQAGLKVSKTWSFGIQIYPDMAGSVAVCTNCHVGYQSDPDMGSGCSLCHTGQFDYPHQGAPASYHAKSSFITSQCTSCHVFEVTIEHARWLDLSGNPMTCATCHGSSATAQVKAAIASGDTACAACHSDPHQHLPGDGYGFVTAGMNNDDHGKGQGVWEYCSECHTTDLMQLHSYDCERCHSDSARATVKYAIANDISTCTQCHPGQHGMFSAENIDHQDIYDSGDCSGCHDASPPVDPYVVSCGTCHPHP